MNRDVIKLLASWKTSAHRKPLVMQGARQVGKTFILKEFGRQYFSNTHYINFEANYKARELFRADLNPKRILKDISFLLDEEVDLTKDLVIFDEVQLAPNGITSLKYFCEDFSELALCAAGSLIGLNLGEDSFPVGKIDFINLYPLTFAEFLQAAGNERLVKHIESLKETDILSEVAHTKIFECLKQYFIIGGMPEVVKLFIEHKEEDLYKATKLVREAQLALVEAYTNDFAKYCGKANALHIERVYRSIPAQIAGQIDAKAHRFQFKEIVPGIAQYSKLTSVFDWLNGAGLSIRTNIIKKPIPPLTARVKESSFKLYLHDVGLLGAMVDIKPEDILRYDFSNFKGYFAENFVAQEFIAYGVRSLYCWKENTSEIEFLLDEGNFAIPVEVKSGNFRHAKSLKTYCEKYNPKKAFILFGHKGGETSIAGAQALPMYMANRLLGLISRD